MYSLAAVNFALFLVGTIQTGRILLYKRSQEGSTAAALKALEQDIASTAKKAEKKVEEKI